MAAGAGAAGPSIGSDPTTFHKQFEKAMMTTDVALLDALLTDDWYLTAIDPNETWNPAKWWAKKRWMDRVKTMKYASRTMLDDVIEQHGDLVIATAHVIARFADPQARGLEMTQQRFYVKRPEGWRLVSMRTVKEIQLS